MARELKKIAFVVEDFSIGSPAQQILDRFLMGYPRDGAFHQCGAEVHVYLPPGAAETELSQRTADRGLRRHATVEETVAGSDGIVVVPARIHTAELLKLTLQAATAGSSVFAYGAMAGNVSAAKELLALAGSRNVALASGTSIAVTWRLPEMDLPAGAPVKRALIVVQGEQPAAELYALDGLLPILERRLQGERGVRSVRGSRNPGMWTSDIEWVPMGLLAAAISRSDSPQGDPVRDGRTQDIVGLGLVPSLAKKPRAWVIEHTDGVRSTIAVLDGVVADINFAVELADGTTLSAQLYRPPAPQRHEFSRLAEVMEKYFISGRAPWPSRRSLLTSGLLAAFARAGEAEMTVATPELEF